VNDRHADPWLWLAFAAVAFVWVLYEEAVDGIAFRAAHRGFEAGVAKIVAKKSFPRPPGSGTKKRGGEEAKRHDDRMKSARYKLEAFIRDYSDMPNGRKLSRQSKHSLERNTMT
jgi:hypothetical protein